MIKKILKYFAKSLGIQHIPTPSTQLSSVQRYLNENLVQIPSSTLTENSKIEIRGQVEKKIYFLSGKDSVLSGMFIFENSHGYIEVGDRSFIGGSTLISIRGIKIGNDVMISWGCTIMDNDAHSLNWKDRVNDVSSWKKGLKEKKTGAYKDWSKVESAPITIADKAWIGFNVIILKGITIGEGAIVAAGSVVTKDVAPYTLVGGNPAKFIKELSE